MRSGETNKIPTSPVFPQKHSIIKTDLISFSSSDIPLTSQGWPCFPHVLFCHIWHVFPPQVEQLLSLEKSGYVCFSDYHTGFTGRFNIYDLVLEKPFFKGWNHLDCIICQLLCDPLPPPSFPPCPSTDNMKKGNVWSRKPAMCILLPPKSEIGRFNLTSSWGFARNLQEIFNLHEKMAATKYLFAK